jgi:hypothetical protein
VTGDEAWAQYQAYVAKARSRMLATPEAAHSRVADQAEYAIVAMQAGCHHFHALHRTDYPAFYRQTVWSPFEAPWGGPSSDMVYAWTFLDGRRSYRIWGKRGTTRFTDLQLFNGYFERGEEMRGLGALDFDQLHYGEDGSFSFTASADKADGDWLPLDRTEPFICAQLRDTWWDWEAERGAEVHIECLDRPNDTMVLPAGATHARLVRSGKLLERTIARAIGYAKMNRQLAGGTNGFGLVLGSASTDHGASSRAGYGGMVWDLNPDEALVITLDPPTARYWSFQLVDMWWMTLDFSYHQSGLNGHQAEIDEDGKVRMVLSVSDPGIANWLDPIGTPTGLVQMRWYDGTVSGAPEVEKLPFSDLGNVLPHARRVAPKERAEAIRRRARASLARWGY